LPLLRADARRYLLEVGLSELDRYRFHLNGYVVIDGALEPGHVKRLKRVIGERGVRPGPAVSDQRFGAGGSGLLGWDQMFCDLIDHPLVLEILRELIGPYVRLDHLYGIVMAAGTSGLGVHGPAWPFDASQYYLHKGGRMLNGLVVFSWALTTSKPGEGGFGCIPGSHRGEEPVPDGAEVLVVEVPQKAGSLLVFTEALAHCTVHWNGREDRLSLLYKYSPANSSWAPHPAAPPEVLPLLTPRQQRLVEPPYVGGRQPAID
jgi:hypothetical protein